jgi:hypothetical protein
VVVVALTCANVLLRVFKQILDPVDLVAQPVSLAHNYLNLIKRFDGRRWSPH